MFRRKIVTFFVFVLLSFISLPIIAQEEAESESDADGFHFSFTLGLGVDTFMEDTDNDGLDDVVMYQKLALGPDFAFGKFGIGFELVFHYQFQNNELTIRPEDWVPEDVTFLNVLQLYVSKFRYIRYGHKGDDIYAKFGSIEDGTLGNGFIMGYYSNSLFLPETRIFGLSFDMDGALFGFPLIGFETFIGNIINWDVLGARLFFRPLVYTGIPVFDAMQVGLSVAGDINPDAYSEIDLGDDAHVLFYDLDIFLPLLSNNIIGLALFGDAATYKFESIGGMVGFGGSLVNVIIYGAQLRFIGEGFMPNYFDGTYDLTRVDDYANIERTSGISPGYIGWLATLGTEIEGLFDFRVILDGPVGEVEPGNTENPSNYPHLRGIITIPDNLVPGFSIEGIYDKAFLRTFEDLISPEDAFILGKLNYQTGPAIISFLYQLSYNADTGDWDVRSGLETSISF
jgi:hypothetical protein